MFEGLTIEELKIDQWEKIEISDDFLLFWKHIYKPERDYDGFNFCCVELFCEVLSDPPVKRYQVVFEGVAYFDGVRHLYFGKEETENYGYLYYQNLQLLIDALKVLDDLQIEQCKYVANERKDTQ